EFDFLKQKYRLSVIPSLQWKFMRMRPVHFPTIRIAQLAVIVSGINHFIPLLSEIKTAEKWIELFTIKPANEYWNTHFHFKASSSFSEKKLGRDTAISLIINVVVPFMFYYGKMQVLNELKEKAIHLLGQLPAEKNAIIKSWQGTGWYVRDAMQTQAMLQLKKEYCDQRKCLHCAIGLQLLK
ncbi:MAG TPA: DUF2851 family protein, partial [Saprospiraceae bacterium]|nr:DUF2851 family protein [Saprospiraceae bacterium]